MKQKHLPQYMEKITKFLSNFTVTSQCFYQTASTGTTSDLRLINLSQ